MKDLLVLLAHLLTTLAKLLGSDGARAIFPNPTARGISLAITIFMYGNY
jgi:hypothetical protein